MEIKSQILLVEDSKEIHVMVERHLADIAHIHSSFTLQEAREFLRDNNPALILLDIELPDGNGVEFCQELQTQTKNTKSPVFFLTAHNELSEKVLGFSVGADDYIVKPFNPIELKARVEAKLKKQSLINNNRGVFEWDKIKIDSSSQHVQVRRDDTGFVGIDLTALEFKILALMAKRPEEVVPRDEILNEIWGKNVHVYPRSVDTHMSKLRRKLGKSPSFIESVHGVGYKFCPSCKNQAPS